MRGFRTTLAAACLVLGFVAAASARDGKPIDCGDTGMSFDAPGFKTSCQDYSDPTASTGGMTFSLKRMALHALSESDGTFLDAIDDHIQGSTRIYYNKTSVESDIDRYFNGDFTGWSVSDAVDGFDVKHFSAKFQGDKEPIDCVAFRRQGARRYSGISGITAGIACSLGGRERADEAMKHFAEGN